MQQIFSFIFGLEVMRSNLSHTYVIESTLTDIYNHPHMAGTERQGQFGEIDTAWQAFQLPESPAVLPADIPKSHARKEKIGPYPEVDETCRNAFNQINDLWINNFAPYVEVVHSGGRQLRARVDPGRQMEVYARERSKGIPRLKDFVFPDSLKDFFERYGEFTGQRENSRLPRGYDTLEATLDIYGQWKADGSNDTLGFGEIAEEYRYWHTYAILEWEARDIFAGWNVYAKGEEKNAYTFKFSMDGSLIGFEETRKHPVIEPLDATSKGFSNYPSLSTTASFRGEKLYSFYREVPNGTLFPDPKGDMDTIWPRWVKKGMDESGDPYDDASYEVEYYGEDNNPATEDDWNWYLSRAKNKQIVLSPVTGNYVQQTQRQARNNLVKSRIYIYNKFPQAFHFYRKPEEPGYYCEIGYSLDSRVGGGKFIPKHPKDPRSHIEPPKEDVLQLLPALIL